MPHPAPQTHKLETRRLGAKLYWLILSTLGFFIVTLNLLMFVGCGKIDRQDLVIEAFHKTASVDEQQQEFFSAGISDTLASQLAGVEGLRIVSDTASAQPLHISGEVFANQTSITIRYYIAQGKDARPFAQGQIEGLRSDLLVLQDSLARQVSAHLRQYIADRKKKTNNSAHIANHVAIMTEV